jgi:hypothetical protein
MTVIDPWERAGFWLASIFGAALIVVTVVLWQVNVTRSRDATDRLERARVEMCHDKPDPGGCVRKARSYR